MGWKITFACTLVLAFLGVARPADQTSDLFSRANGFYQKAEFESAEREYRELLNAGYADAAVYYNLGNACFKQKKLGEAIYYWEKALQESPGDSETRENLDFASLLVVDRIDTPQNPLPVRLLDKAVHFLNPRTESVIGLILFVAANGLLSFCLLSRSPRAAFRSLTAALALGLVAALIFCSIGWKAYEKGHRLEAIIIEPKVDVRSGPGLENMTVVTVHEGIKVNVRSETDGWYQISLPNGWNGWLPRNCIRIL